MCQLSETSVNIFKLLLACHLEVFASMYDGKSLDLEMA